MSKHRLKVTLTDQPEPDAAVSTRKVSIRSRIARKLPGDESVTWIEPKVLKKMAAAEAAAEAEAETQN